MAAKRKKTSTKKTTAKTTKTKSSSAKKSSSKKASTTKKVSKAKSTAASASVKKKSTPKKASSTKANTKKTVSQKAPAVESKSEKSQAALEREERRNKAAQAMQEALNETESTEEDEFDPEAFFAASGGKGIFRAHVMRKERVDLNIPIRYRKERDPIVHNAELMNLSKGGLCLRIDEVLEAESTLRIEIPLPHTSELFRVQTQIVWSQRMEGDGSEIDQPIHAGMIFLPMSLAKQTVINNFIQQRRDELIMAKIGLDKFTDSVPVAGLD